MNMPRMFPGEPEAIATVIALGEQYGYGNLINRLKEAWSKRLQERDGLDVLASDFSAGLICPWCDTDCRTGKKSRAAKKARAK